jgi:hypothetical protein
MLNDTQLMKAASSLRQRSESRQEERKIVQTFVDVGILAQLTNQNHQIVYGRRGTGKTHVLQVLANRFRENRDNTVMYIDGRTLGSTSQYSDSSVTLTHRCTSLFRDLLNEVYNAVLDHIINEPRDKAEVALSNLDEFGKVATEPFRTATEEIVTGKEKGKTQQRTTFDASIGPPKGVQVGAHLGGLETSETERTVTYRVSSEDKVIFPAVHSSLKKTLENAKTTLIILFDEWSSLPQDIQPYLAEFLKRGFAPNPNVVLKMASLEYRSRFRLQSDGKIIGFEIGSDISTIIDLDDYYVFDRNPEKITAVFADILFRHITSELPENYLRTKYSIESSERLISQLFTSKSTFRELARASEGVARDFINIFTAAYFDSQRRGRNNIEIKSIFEAARQWFEKDKEQNLDDSLRAVLTRIVDKVIGKRHARAFLIPRELEKHPVVQSLFDSRVLHLLQRGYADKDNPGRRYNIYTLDYGTYVDLINTSKQPLFEITVPESSSASEQARFEMPETDDDTACILVPFDDKRSIRRIVLTEAELKI